MAVLELPLMDRGCTGPGRWLVASGVFLHPVRLHLEVQFFDEASVLFAQPVHFGEQGGNVWQQPGWVASLVGVKLLPDGLQLFVLYQCGLPLNCPAPAQLFQPALAPFSAHGARRLKRVVLVQPHDHAVLGTLNDAGSAVRAELWFVGHASPSRFDSLHLSRPLPDLTSGESAT